MDWVIDTHTAEALLMQYSEWLDVENIQIHNDDDGRTHDQLVKQFIAERNPAARPKVLDDYTPPDGGCEWHEETHRRVCMSEHAAEVAG